MRVPAIASALGSEIVRILLGSPCIVCGNELPVRARVASCCAACWQSLPRIKPPRCCRCGIPWSTDAVVDEFTCIECVAEPPPLDWIDSWGEYESGLVKVLHAFKFGGHDFLASSLGGMLSEVFAARADSAFDVIVPVPMHRAKQRKRGYNQAELLAAALAGQTGLRLDAGTLVKVVERDAQSMLPKEARRANVRGAYAASATARGLRALLVDDICTTAETLRACSLALKKAGAKRVAAVTVARTL